MISDKERITNNVFYMQAKPTNLTLNAHQKAYTMVFLHLARTLGFQPTTTVAASLLLPEKYVLMEIIGRILLSLTHQSGGQLQRNDRIF